MGKGTVTIARRMASQMWGEVQKQLKVADGIWLFTTGGHGGYIVDTNKHPELRNENTTVYINAKSSQYRPTEQHFAAFEEDCEYAKVEWLYPYTMKRIMQRYALCAGMTLESWQKLRLKGVKGNLERWNPEFLREYPNHGPLKEK